MKKLLLLAALLVGACTKRTIEEPMTPSPAAAPIAPVAINGPRPALDAFLAAVRAQDVQALAMAWGDKKGSVQDVKPFPREDMEQRGIVMIRCLKHDKYRVVGEAPAADSERLLQVELTSGTQSRVLDFFTAKGSDRWYVRYANPVCPPK